MVPVFVIIIAIIQTILFSAHWVVYKALVSIFSISNHSALLSLRIILGVLSISFVVASLITFRYYNSAVSIFYTITAVWLGALLYLFLASVLYWLVVGIGALLSINTIATVFGKIFILIALIVSAYAVIHAYDVVVTNVEINLLNLPTSWQGRKAVWISDIHLGDVHNLSFILDLNEKIKALQPDIVFIGGDLFDSSSFPVATAIQPLSNLRAPLGVYFITGNHEEFFNKSQYLNVIEQAGIKILNNKAVEVDGVKIIGVDYSDTAKRSNYEEILKNLTSQKSGPIILLRHSPAFFDIAAKYGIDLQISGHTHRAQMFPLNLITYLVYKGFDYGLHKFNSMFVYTSSGVGTWGPPLRVGSPSEIVLIKFN